MDQSAIDIIVALRRFSDFIANDLNFGTLFK